MGLNINQDPEYSPLCSYCDDRGCENCDFDMHLAQCPGCEDCAPEDYYLGVEEGGEA